jgi:hypothetical protein
MLHLYSSRDKVPDNVHIVNDVEKAFFPYVRSESPLKGEVYDKIMRDIDKVSNRNNKIITNMIGELSTGCKACLIAIDNPEYAVSNVEMGGNVIGELFKLSPEYDSSVVLDFPIAGVIPEDNIKACLDGECMLSQDLMEELRYRESLKN